MLTITLNKLFRVAASYGLCIALLFFLLVLTFIGTLEQVNHSLYEVQEKYFGSLFLVHELPGGIPVPMPGVYLITLLLFVNLTLGAIVRARKNWKKPGMIVAHSGILMLLLAGFVTFHFSTNGNLRLYEGETLAYFEDYNDWNLAVTEVGDGGVVYLFPAESLQNATPTTPKALSGHNMPLELSVTRYLKNSRPRQAMDGEAGAVDGVVLADFPAATGTNTNIMGIELSANGEPGEDGQNGLLWAASRAPWTVSSADREYSLRFENERYELPFTITLDKFIRDLHPGTSMAANFESRISLTDTGIQRQIEVKMNQPLRHRGYTFYQASWGPENAAPGTRLYSTFAVVRNPADQWPKYACYVIGLGLTIHFLQSLMRYLRSENRRRANG